MVKVNTPTYVPLHLKCSLHPIYMYNIEATTTPQLEQKCSECSGTIGDLKDQLRMALATIDMLRKEVDLLKQ